MPRSAVPSAAQQEQLLECLEEKQWLVTGYARTANARKRTNMAWQEIATKLNSDGSGCIKSAQQWTKYFKDKKSAVKKKFSQIRLARQQTGGGAIEEITPSVIEERILSLMGGEAFAVGDRELEINPFHVVQDDANVTTDTDATVSESVLQAHIGESMAVEPGTAGLFEEQTLSNIPVFIIEPMAVESGTAAGPLGGRGLSNIPNTQAASSSRNGPEPPESHQMAQSIPEAAPTLLHARTAPAPAAPVQSPTSSPRRRRLVPRRRAAHRSPPSQRRTQLASLTERFIAIEERRVETEHMIAQNQRELIEVVKNMSEAWSRQNQAIIDLVNKTNT